MLASLTCKSFGRHLNKTFQIHTANAVVAAELIEVEEVGKAADDEGCRQPFALVFRAPKEQAFEQGVYRLEADGFDSMELMLVPIGIGDDGAQYEAVFA